jgi:carbamoylphosphate synthase large subunit
MRDGHDNCVVVCSIENFDPMGVHTGDSVTVAPAQTLSDRCYQKMRDAAFRVMRTIKVEAGGSNIQFAVHPDSGEMRVIEMNPACRAARRSRARRPGSRSPRSRRCSRRVSRSTRSRTTSRA